MESRPIFAELAAFACDAGMSKFPATVVDRVNWVVMDLIGSAYSALPGRGAQALWRYASDSGVEQASLWGTGRRVGAADAALVNGALAYEVEFDDGNSLGGHWGSSSIPAIIALAEQGRVPAEKLVRAVVLAYEVADRISRPLSPRLLVEGVHFPGTMGAIAAVTGAAVMKGFQPEKLAAALGHAALSPVAPYHPGHVGVDTKNLYSGWSNFCGIHFAALADAGYSGAPDLLEAAQGLAAVLRWRGTVEELRDRVLDGLGDSWAILRTYFKPFPCCRWLHAPVQGVLRLRAQHGLTCAQVAEIQVHAPQFLAMYATPGPYVEPIQAKYSLPFCVAAAMLLGKLDHLAFTSPNLEDARVLALSENVRVELDEKLERRFPESYQTRTVIVTRDGAQYESVDIPPWGPEAPPRFDALARKFYRSMSLACGERIAEDWISYFRRGLLEDPNLERFFDLLSRSVIGVDLR